MDRWLQVLSTMATQPLEDVAKAGKDGPLQLFQLYVIKDRDFCKRLIQRKPPSHVPCVATLLDSNTSMTGEDPNLGVPMPDSGIKLLHCLHAY